MAATAKWYGQAQIKAYSKEIDWLNDTIKVMLCTSSYVPNQDTHVYKDVSVDNEVVGDGYTAGGATLASKTLAYDAGTNITKFDAADTVWAASTITARYAVIYDDTPASSKPLLGYVDFGEDEVSTSTDFTIQWSSDGVLKITTQ